MCDYVCAHTQCTLVSVEVTHSQLKEVHMRCSNEYPYPNIVIVSLKLCTLYVLETLTSDSRQQGVLSITEMGSRLQDIHVNTFVWIYNYL